MMNEVVQVPVSLLLSPELPPSAKLVWMVSRLHPGSEQAGSTWLSVTSGLSRDTVLKGISLLEATGWHHTTPTVLGATVPVPADLLTNHRLGISARVLYGILLLIPGFSHPSGYFTYAELAGLAQASRNTVEKSLAELAKAEWIIVERANRLARVRFELTLPGLIRGLNALHAAQERLARGYHGEGIMREYLTLLIDSDEYQDNATPGWLVNPRTGQLLELDRFYPPAVAFEYQGPQHFRKTEKYDAATVAAQQERDYLKLGICFTRGVTLVYVLPEDLTLAGMRQKVGHLLPRRDITGHELLIDFLADEAIRHRRSLSRL